jgi:hypothetical protein
MNGHYRLASAFRTSDWDKPNCRAICEGLTPTFKVARTAVRLSRSQMNGHHLDPRLVGALDACLHHHAARIGPRSNESNA